MSNYNGRSGKGHRHTNESLGQGRGFDEMADDNVRASPHETLIKDEIDAETALEIAELGESGATGDPTTEPDPQQTGGVTDDGQPLEPDYTYVQQYSHVDPSPSHTKPLGVADRPAADPREPGPNEWTPAHDRTLCEEGAEVLGEDEVDDDDAYDDYDPAEFDPIEPQPYLTEMEERILGEWAERQRNADHAIELAAAHGRIDPDGFGDRPEPDGRTERADLGDAEAGEPSLAAELVTHSRVADLKDTLECTMREAREQLVTLAEMNGIDAAVPEIEAEADADAETETEPDAAPDLGPEASAADAMAAVANGGTGTADMAVNAVFPAPKMGHREGYTRAASAHREPIRHATDAYAAPARTVGYRDPEPETLAEAAAAEKRADQSPVEALDADTREAVLAEAERFHEQYPFFATETAAVAIARQLVEHDGSVQQAVLAVTDEIAAWTGITPIGQLDPDDPPEQPYEQPQATIQGTVTTLYEPADASQQQVGLIDDGTGTIKLTVWEKSDIDTVLHEGDTVRVVDGVIDTYKGQPTIAALGEQQHLPYSARQHRGSFLRVLDRGDGPAPIHGLHYQVDWSSGVGFPGEQRLEHGPATDDEDTSGPDDETDDPRALLAQPTLAAINQAAHRLATESDLDASRAVIGRVLAARVAESDAATDEAVSDALMAVLTQPHLVEDAAIDTDGADTADGDDALPEPSLPRVTPGERWNEPVEHPDSATKFTLETAFTAGTWLYTDETYPAPDAWPIYHRKTDRYGNLEEIAQAGTLTLPADTPTQVERERPSAPSPRASDDDDEWTLYTATAHCPQCEAEVDANVEIKQLRAADEAGTRIFEGACGHTWRGDD